MEFCLTPEQEQLQDEIGRALARLCPLDRVRAACAQLAIAPADTDGDIRDLGLAGIVIAEAHGGSGRGVLDAALIAEMLGRHAVPAPYLAQAVMAPLAIARAGSPAQQAALLPRLARGELRIAVGISEAAAGARGNAGITARDGRLSGAANFVIDSAGADLFLVADTARNLHLLHASALGITLTPLDPVDRTRSVCRLDLADAAAEPLPQAPQEALPRIIAAGRVVLAADMLGAAWHMLETAIAYAGQRRQFGRVIGSFQAVKHMCAEAAAELEPGRALLWHAGHALDTGRADALLAALHAKAYLADAARLVARTATEVHGGIGITDALGLHFWFKRIGLDFQLLGGPARLRSEAARLQGFAA